MSAPQGRAAAQDLGRKASRAILVIVLLQQALGPVLLVVNMIIVVASGTVPGNPEGWESRASRWRGLLPIEPTWWQFLIASIPLALVLAAIWNERTHFRPAPGRMVRLRATPRFIALFAAVWAIEAFAIGSYYVEPAEVLTYTAPAAFLSLLIAGVALARGLATRPTTKRGRR